MKYYRYRITLFDPLYYAREGLAAAYTPHVLHGTAVNHAITAACGLHPENQPFVMAETNGGMDVPRYADSRASSAFYFTPGAILNSPGDWAEIAKGDNEGFAFRVVAGEILKATQLHFLPPETEFVGLAIATSAAPAFPSRIRLGSFRGVAKLEFERAEDVAPVGDLCAVDHPVDPLVSSAVRGVMLNLFPYPVVQQAICRQVYRLTFAKPRFGPATARLAWPAGFAEPAEPERLRPATTAII
jgi:hypothetical protein